MELQALGYLVVGSSKLDEWRSFATELLGMQVVEHARSALALRTDARKQRLVIDPTLPEGRFIIGWEVKNAASLAALGGRLESAGIRVTVEPRSLADQRYVHDIVSFQDPAGNRLEVFHRAAEAEQPFRPGRAISGFRTGALGLGHAVLTVASMQKVLPFYRDMLGLPVSDYMLAPFHAYFFHVNARHHSLALIESGSDGLHHLMVELCSLDDVGQGYDIAQDRETVSVTLGRHSNDFMTSFYSRSPSPFLVEYGWGGRQIEPSTWKPVQLDCGPSLWGHERDWLPEDKRMLARQMRMQAATESRRAPVYVMRGNHEVASDPCPWWREVPPA